MMNGLKAVFKENSASLASGILIGTSYIPFPPWALFFCYAPLWLLASRETSLKRVFISGWITQFVLTLIGFHWISYTAFEFGHLPWPIAFLALILFCSTVHIYIPLSLVLIVYLKRHFNFSRAKTILLFALSLIFWERYWPSLFPWNLGYTFLGAHWPIYHWADVIGFEGLSAFVLLMNASIGLIWLHCQNNRKKMFVALFTLIAFVGVLTIMGQSHGQKWSAFDSSIRILAVQANIGNFEKIQAEKGRGSQDEILNQHINLTNSSLEKNPLVDLIIWPETAIPEYLDKEYKDGRRSLRLRETINRWQKPVLTGALSREYWESDPNKNVFNSVFLLPSQMDLHVKPYRKTYLLAFGEYLPFSEKFPFLLRLLPFISNFGRGLGPQTLELPAEAITSLRSFENFKIGIQICYEGLYPEFTRTLSLLGTDLLANVTNDSWFGRPFEPHQHMIMTLGRAIEIRRPLIRATNTGITTAILADGTQLLESPLHEVWSGVFEIKYQKNPSQTFYASYGAIDFWFYLFLFTLTLGISWKYDRT